MKYPLVFITWLAFSIVSMGFMNKAFETDVKFMTKERCEHWAAIDQSMAVLISAGGPISFIIAMAISGFGQDGWSLSRHSCEKSNR